MTRTPRTVAIALLIALAFTATACGSSDSEGASDTTSPTTEAAADPTDEANEPVDDTEPAEEETEAGDAACEADSNELSGSSTVVWDDGDVAPELIMTFTDDDTLDPATLTVPVGERFAIASPAGSDLRAVKVGCAGAQTVPGGITAGFVIDAPGTYVIIDEAANDYAGAEVGSVTVE